VSPPAQDFLGLARPTVARWHGDLETTDRQDLQTRPGSRIFFPAWNTTTAELPQRSAPVAQDGYRSMMMPKRQHTRAADRTLRILEERALSDAHVAERNRPPVFYVPKQNSRAARDVHDHADADEADECAGDVPSVRTKPVQRHSP
jgi:hypothetical protein